MIGDNWTDDECYYVDCTDAGRVALLAGPFSTHAAALARVDAARELADQLDPRAWFYNYGTCKRPNGHYTGILNSQLEAMSPQSIPTCKELLQVGIAKRLGEN